MLRTTLCAMEQAVANEIGQVIASALARRNQGQPRSSRISQREAARRAGIHESWWRTLVAGGQQRGDAWVPAKGAPETYLSMATVVGVEDEVRGLLGDEAPTWSQKSVPEVTQSPDTLDVDSSATTPATVEAIRRDPRLMDVARVQLLRQYEMYAQLSDLIGNTENSEQARPQTPAEPARPLRAVARKRPSPRRDKP